MKNKYTIPLVVLTTSYIIYKKFYAIDFKELFNHSQGRSPKDGFQSPLFTNPELIISPDISIGKSIDDIDWEGITG